ncbi:MAG: isoprenylcysteine carboxylmethyltransferase family protein [Stygiobacter sp.]|jgi:protein-S-isoprenylcysteine O-methyltransferase Ste14|uniref:Isoprenylcysteine carboxylmethyltransferase family protein n=1 Tax=Stygiobacter electus TaxID=3032292 RepID=A0AAE3P0F4_9BACT|nr:isoprenylcysteine carboxylmethyltransferase family protein [Stygiobacter electus]MDF1610763.1 isoprenylcysteine carboxylmethyltransferase family protein [Stygiobacter electus]
MKNFSLKVFKYRSYTPIPFLLLMLIFQNSTTYSLIFGFIIAAIGEFFRFWGVIYAGSETRRTGEVGATYLVVSGAFAHVRNPLYLGNMLMYFGVSIMSFALVPYLQIAVIVFFFLQYYIIISEEEKFLKETYKKDYDNYLSQVPKLIPALKKYINPGLVQPPRNLKAGLKSEMRTLQASLLIIILITIRHFLH